MRSENLSKHNDFADVTEDSWYNTAVSTMAGMNILKGRTANSFAPQAPSPVRNLPPSAPALTAAEQRKTAALRIFPLIGRKKEIERAATLGWVSGYTDGSFHPDAPITRAEAMTLINRVLCRMPETKADLLDSMTKWPDNQPGAWYYLAVQEATNSHTYEQKDSKYETWTALDRRAGLEQILNESNQKGCHSSKRDDSLFLFFKLLLFFKTEDLIPFSPSQYPAKSSFAFHQTAAPRYTDNISPSHSR